MRTAGHHPALKEEEGLPPFGLATAAIVRALVGLKKEERAKEPIRQVTDTLMAITETERGPLPPLLTAVSTISRALSVLMEKEGENEMRAIQPLASDIVTTLKEDVRKGEATAHTLTQAAMGAYMVADPVKAASTLAIVRRKRKMAPTRYVSSALQQPPNHVALFYICNHCRADIKYEEEVEEDRCGRRVSFRLCGMCCELTHRLVNGF